MPTHSTVEIKDLALVTRIGTFKPNEAVPKTHHLDLTLSIDPRLVLIAIDDMAHVFDYDPLVAEIDRIARDGHYETQERLITRIVQACATHDAITALEIFLRKGPVLADSGMLGLRLTVDGAGLAAIRQAL
ncbi:MAG: dihydroneopterin aldolase [Orrella sp.]